MRIIWIKFLYFVPIYDILGLLKKNWIDLNLVEGWIGLNAGMWMILIFMN